MMGYRENNSQCFSELLSDKERRKRGFKILGMHPSTWVLDVLKYGPNEHADHHVRATCFNRAPHTQWKDPKRINRHSNPAVPMKDYQSGPWHANEARKVYENAIQQSD